MFYNNFTVNVLLFSAAVFVLAKSIFGGTKYGASIFHKTIAQIGKNSLGIYAVHAAVITVVARIFPQIHPLLAIPSLFVICTAISLLASCIIARIPLIRKFV